MGVLERGENLPLQDLYIQATQRPEGTTHLHKPKGIQDSQGTEQRLQRKNPDGNQILNRTQLPVYLQHNQGIRKGRAGNYQKNPDHEEGEGEKNQQETRKTDGKGSSGTSGVGENLLHTLIFLIFYFFIKFF